MNYAISNLPSVKLVNGTSFHGQTLYFTYADLVKTLGEPEYMEFGFEEKNTVRWCLFLEQEDGMDVIFTLYDWYEPCKPQVFPDTYSEWHIGSFEPLPLDVVVKIRQFIESKIL